MGKGRKRMTTVMYGNGSGMIFLALTTRRSVSAYDGGRAETNRENRMETI